MKLGMPCGVCEKDDWMLYREHGFSGSDRTCTEYECLGCRHIIGVLK